MTAGVPQAEAIVSALAGRVELARGRLGSACEALSKSLWAMSGSLPPGWVMLVASWLTQAEGARGNAAAAAASLARAEKADGPQVAVFAPELELARAWEHASTGQTTAAQDHANRAAKITRSAGMHAVEMMALHTAVRFGDRSASARLGQLSALLNCPLAEAVMCHARGMSEHSGDRLDDAADQFERLGACAMAADASAHAAREHGRDGARVNELESSSRAHWLASQWGMRTPATNAIDSPLPITDREREIANLVGGGLTNREIADRLGLSVRTVDGHLYRTYAKLGIEDRDQLARLIRMRPAT
jgi:DNA-binding CsgD family transcriptional regulator